MIKKYIWIEEETMKSLLRLRQIKAMRDDQQTSLSEHQPGVKQLMERLRNGGKKEDIQDTYAKAVR